ncbi:hypothetical protein BH11VER1_BH11VER1_28840 [soil metagenome]
MNEETNTPQVTPMGLEYAKRLEDLLVLPFDDAVEIKRWEDEAGVVQEWIRDNFSELPQGFPKYIMFYFHDPDIRAREPEYRNHQEQKVRLFIRQLRGEAPLDNGSPWWRFW